MCPLPPSAESGDTVVNIVPTSSSLATVDVRIVMQKRRLFSRDGPTLPSMPVIVEEKDESDESKTRPSAASSSSSSSSTAISSDSDRLPSRLDEFLVVSLGRALDSIVQQGDRLVKSAPVPGKLFVGASGKACTVPLTKYLRRLVQYTDRSGLGSSSWRCLSNGTIALIMALVYIDRLALTAGVQVNSFTVHRLLATGILVALKMNEDESFLLTGTFASLAGVSKDEMFQLEEDFVNLLKWDLHVKEHDFAARVAFFEKLCTSQKIKKKNTQLQGQTVSA